MIINTVASMKNARDRCCSGLTQGNIDFEFSNLADILRAEILSFGFLSAAVHTLRSAFAVCRVPCRFWSSASAEFSAWGSRPVRRVLAGICPDFAPVHADGAHFRQLQMVPQFQHGHKRRVERRLAGRAKRA